MATSLSLCPGSVESSCLHCELPRWLGGKESACQGRRRRFDPWVGRDPLEEEITAHSSILAWRIPWTGEPGGLQCMGSQRVGHS